MAGPPITQHNLGAAASPAGYMFGDGVWQFTNAGVPTDGTSGTGAAWAGPGSLCVDTTNMKLYINGNTKASPTWKLVTSAS